MSYFSVSAKLGATNQLPLTSTLVLSLLLGTGSEGLANQGPLLGIPPLRCHPAIRRRPGVGSHQRRCLAPRLVIPMHRPPELGSCCELDAAVRVYAASIHHGDEYIICVFYILDALTLRPEQPGTEALPTPGLAVCCG